MGGLHIRYTIGKSRSLRYGAPIQYILRIISPELGNAKHTLLVFALQHQMAELLVD